MQRAKRQSGDAALPSRSFRPGFFTALLFGPDGFRLLARGGLDRFHVEASAGGSLKQRVRSSAVAVITIPRAIAVMRTASPRRIAVRERVACDEPGVIELKTSIPRSLVGSRT
ncbi:MAG: hypothetical protein ACRD2P_07320 [Terriglobia bacterium]